MTNLQAFSSLAEAAFEAADVADDEKEPNTYCLSAYYEPIVQKLLETTDRFVMFSLILFRYATGTFVQVSILLINKLCNLFSSFCFC